MLVWNVQSYWKRTNEDANDPVEAALKHAKRIMKPIMADITSDRPLFFWVWIDVNEFFEHLTNEKVTFKGEQLSVFLCKDELEYLKKMSKLSNFKPEYVHVSDTLMTEGTRRFNIAADVQLVELSPTLVALKEN